MLSAWQQKCYDNLLNVRRKAPLVHNITNFVVMNSSANILLSIGAQPVMAHALSEVEDMVKLSSALVINIGTLDETWVSAMIKAGLAANSLGIPIVFDPVGAGATKFRTDKSLEILDLLRISVLRGNASEISAIAGFDGAMGVDSIHNVDNFIDISRDISNKYSCVVGISGERDLISDSRRVARVANGHSIMTRVTGTGCGLSATTGAFIAANEDPFEAVVSAFSYYSLAGELAYKIAQHPGSFESAFIDALEYINIDDFINANIQVEE